MDLPKYIILDDPPRALILRQARSSRYSADAEEIVYHTYLSCNSAADAERTIKALDAYE